MDGEELMTGRLMTYEQATRLVDSVRDDLLVTRHDSGEDGWTASQDLDEEELKALLMVIYAHAYRWGRARGFVSGYRARRRRTLRRYKLTYYDWLADEVRLRGSDRTVGTRYTPEFLAAVHALHQPVR